jgi:hypothetical protein
MAINTSIPASALVDLYVRLRDEIDTHRRSLRSLDPNDSKRAALAMAILQASALIPNNILGVEEQLRLLLQPTMKIGT